MTGKVGFQAQKRASISTLRLIFCISDEKFAKNLEKYLSHDRDLAAQAHFIEKQAEAEGLTTGRRLWVIEAQQFDQLLPQIEDSLSSVVVIFDRLSVEAIRRIFDRYLHIKGFFLKGKLLDNLEELGRLARTLKEELRLLSPNETDSVQELGTLLPLGTSPSEDREYTSLFIDPKVRRFLHTMATLLERLKSSELAELGRDFHRQGHADKLQGFFADLSRLLGKGSKDVDKSLEDQIKADYKILLQTITQPPGKRLLPSHILIRGETGSGKTLIARWIARYLDLERRFQHLNVSSLPETLIESELFGSLKGAFTGAVNRPGALLKAYGGVVFLDEIGDLPLEVQAKLLVYMDDYSFRPLGWPIERSIYAPAYVIAATNRPLERMIQEGQFRRDLFHRFTYKLYLPSIRDRKSDLPLLVDLVLQDERINPKEAIQGISYKALRVLEDYPFKGNFRELEDLLGRAVAIATQASENILLEKHICRAIMELEGLLG